MVCERLKMNRPIRIYPLILLAGLLLPVAGFSQSFPVPHLSGHVNDYADIITEPTEERLERILSFYEDSTTNQVVVLTIASLDGADLERTANNIFNTWGLGTAHDDNGVLLLISRDDRKMRIEVGQGLEGFLPDSYCGRIIRNDIAPYFKEGDYDAGIEAGLNNIIRAADGISPTEAPMAMHGFPTWLKVLLWILGIILVIVGISLFRNWRRNRPRLSKKTGMPLNKLAEDKDDAHLTAGQRTEEKIGSVDYDVWITDEGDDIQIIAYKKWISKYSKCPYCKYKAWYKVYRHTVVSPSYTSSGRGEKKMACAHCKQSKISSYHIPKLVRSTSSSGGSSWGGSSGGGSWGGGGGGFSGGGGYSGGGGASGGW